METAASDYDGAWKETLELYWRSFVELCFPNVAAGIDWTQPHVFLDKELQDVVRDADSGRRFVDKLVKVIRTTGQEHWVLVHVEVQSDPDPTLPVRMYQYHYRLSDRYQRSVASLAVLADDQPDWFPGDYRTELWGCRTHFEYLRCKLLDFSDEQLEQSDNPVALVIAAQRAAQRTVRDPSQRQRLKLQLVRQLYARGFGRQAILDLLRLIDWQIALPKTWEIAFQKEVQELEKEKVMPYVTSFERLGMERGRAEAARESIEEALLARFGVLPDDVKSAIAKLEDSTSLKQWLRLAVTVPSLGEFLESVHSHQAAVE